MLEADDSNISSPIRENTPLASVGTSSGNSCTDRKDVFHEATFEVAGPELREAVRVSGRALGSSDDGVDPSCPTWAEGVSEITLGP